MTPEPEALLEPLRRLTAREREVLRLDCQGLTAAQIAEALNIGERTVYGHFQRIYAKLGLEGERDNLRQRQLVFFCLALPRLDEEDGAAGAGPAPPEPPDAGAPPSPAEAASFARDHTAIVRWRRGELRGPDLPAPPIGETPGDPAAPRPPARLLVVGPGADGPPRGRPTWGLLVVVAVLAALLGGALTAAALSRQSRPTAQAESPAATIPESVSHTAALGSASQEAPTPIPSAAPATPTPGTPATATPRSTIGAGASPPASAPAPSAVATVNSDATPIDLTGKAASDAPGTLLALGQAVRSVVDVQTKPRDVYALRLRVGQRLRVDVAASDPDLRVTLTEPGAPPAAVTLCSFGQACAATMPIAATGDYRLALAAGDTGIRYTLRARALPPDAVPGQRDLAGDVASDLPGTPLDLGATVASIIDVNTKPIDAYALTLSAGQTLAVDVEADSPDYRVTLAPPGAAPFGDQPAALRGTTLCDFGQACRRTFPVAAGGRYALVLEAGDAGIAYTLQATAQ